MMARPRSRRVVLGVTSRSGRAKKRQALGTFKDLRVRKLTRKRQTEANARFSWHVRASAMAVDTFF